MRLLLAGLLSLLVLSTPGLSDAYQFPADPKLWTDAEVESFLFLSQIQGKTGLNKDSNLCIAITEPVPGGKQTMRIISKVGDNGKGGLFVTGKAEIAKGSPEEADLNRIKQIATMASGYQAAIMDYDESKGMPTVNPDTKSYMSAQVIGYTDGEGIGRQLSASLSNSGQTYTTNKELGMYRAKYLSTQLGLSGSFGQVVQSSIQAEPAMKDDKYKDIRECATWRTAEVRMSFQTGSKVTDSATWAMATQMAPEKQRLMMQYEAARQMREALTKLDNQVMRVEKPWPSPSPGGTPNPTDRPYLEINANLQSYCDVTLKWFKQYREVREPRVGLRPVVFSGCKVIPNAAGRGICYYDCDQGRLSLTPPGSQYGAPIDFGASYWPKKTEELAAGVVTISDAQFKELIKAAKDDSKIKAALKVMQDERASKLDEVLKASFPECAADATLYSDLKTLMNQVLPVLSSCRAQSPNPDVKSDDACAQAATLKAPNGTGMSGRLMKCISMKRVMDSMYSQGECRPGKDFTKVTFPHMNASLGCKYCGSGWSTHDGAAEFKERYDFSVTHFHDQNTTATVPTFGALQKPGIHQISGCADCSCTEKSKKLAKIFTVEEASRDKSVIDSIDKNSCYCTPPVAPSCAVGPQGATGESSDISLGQKYFYDSCAQKFVAVATPGTGKDAKSAQILNLVQQFNSGCGTDPKQCAQTLGSARSKVNNMLCESQGVKVPTDDPIRDCSKEAGVTFDQD
jgi:hypothetical protein